MLASREPRPSSPSGAELARRFRALYLRELDFVWTVLLRLGVDEGEVEDAAHDVFVVVHRQLPRFEGRSRERTWLYAIARRVAWHHRRTERRRARRHAALATVSPMPVELDDVLRAREARELLAAFLETLDRPQREAFVLGELEALPRSSLGRALGVSPGTAYSRLRAARAAFAAAFGPDGPRHALVSDRARAREPLPRDARHRLWLALPGLGTMAGAASTSGVVAFTATLAVGLGLLGAVAAGRAEPAVRRDVPVDVAARSRESEGIEPRERSPERGASIDLARVTSPSPARGESGAGSTSSARRAAGASAEALPARASPRGSLPSPRADEHPEASPEALAEEAASPEALAQEAALLAEARAAMRAERWTQARALLERHAERFPSGLLATERRASAVMVACRQGREQDALDEARALWSGSVSTAVRVSLRASCIGERIDPGR